MIWWVTTGTFPILWYEMDKNSFEKNLLSLINLTTPGLLSNRICLKPFGVWLIRISFCSPDVLRPAGVAHPGYTSRQGGRAVVVFTIQCADGRTAGHGDGEVFFAFTSLPWGFLPSSENKRIWSEHERNIRAMVVNFKFWRYLEPLCYVILDMG